MTVLRADFSEIQNSRVPEEYVSVILCQDDDNPQLECLREFRALRKQHFDLIMKLEALTTEIEELETKDAVQSSSIKAKNFMAREKIDAVPAGTQSKNV